MTGCEAGRSPRVTPFADSRAVNVSGAPDRADLVRGSPRHASGSLDLDGWRFAFGEVRHRRLRPVRHAFRYPAFFLRLPAHRLDGTPRGSWLFGVERRALLSFRESDHGDGSPVREWIARMLREAGVHADGELWLHTFPRVLGYAFKPVSFWFCHDRTGALRAVVAEVNNTFGERHCYLLADPAGAPLRRGAELHATKVFHVSPFCPVRGDYRFRFIDNGERAVARIDYDDGEGPLLETSLSGRLEPLGRASTLRALSSYPLFTFGVIARIHWHALRLWLARVPFLRKPAPSSPFVTRGSS
jgi:hypothetical protein